jgi:L-gulonolactone oxidase
VALPATSEMLRQIAKSGEGSFLAVLKTFGPKTSPGLLSFPREGTTLALDFPNRGASTMALLARLDDVVREAGGRLYPAKDGRMPPAMFAQGYPNVANFSALTDPKFSSAFWRRMRG